MEIRKILLVDDEKHVRRIAEISLSLVKEWQVTTASSGAEALAKVQEEVPDLILMDVRMPDMDGVETVKKLRENPLTANVAVILLSGSESQQVVQEESDLKFVGMILKPYNAAKLPEQIRTMTADL